MHQEKKMLAHISEDGTRVQTVADHLQGTAVLCGQFAAAFDAQQQGTWLGLLHDIGKYSTKFQKRLQGGEKVDHSTAGAQVAARYGQIPLAFAIAGHHSGLPDGGGRSDTAQDATMFGRLKKGVEPYTQWTNEIKLPSIPPQPEMMKENRFTQAFYTRMLYSCLVDADYLDTENFMSSPKPRGQGQTMDELLKRLNQYTAKWSHPQGTLNQRRSSILSACTTAGQTGRRGLYSLTVPTGGGKTVASLAFALSLAVKNHMDRVIYVIPYTSIIDQTADVFSEILGAENVLEHHSGVDYSAKEDDEPAAYRKALAAENWDAPVVVTTSVQFFESLYGNHASQCRKLHNIANSVVIFDEAQNLPVPYLRPCVAAIAQLVQHYRAAAVLCTATQPALQPLFDELAPGLQMTELCPHPKEQYQAFRRTTSLSARRAWIEIIKKGRARRPGQTAKANRGKGKEEKLQADTTGTETAHERANRLAHAPPHKHKANTGGDKCCKGSNDSRNGNLTGHCSDNTSPVRSGHGPSGDRICQRNKFLHCGNGHNVNREHQNHLI